MVLQETLRASGVSLDTGFRVEVRAEGLGLRLDQASGDDRVVERDGAPLILMAPEVEEVVGDALIDIVRVGERLELVVRKAAEEPHVWRGRRPVWD